MDPLTLNHFAGHVGHTFRTRTDEAEHDLVLEAAEALAGSPRESGGFRLVFRGPLDPVLPQAIYALSSGETTHDIFIVPIDQDAAGTQYEAVFF